MTTAPITTWLPVPGAARDTATRGAADPAGSGDADDVFALLPAGYEQLRALYRSLFDADVDPVTLELCRLRVAALVRSPVDLAARDPRAVAAGLDDATVAALPSWPTARCFDDAQRCALGIAEQFVVDPHGFTDDDAAAAHVHYTPTQLSTLTIAIAVFDALARIRAVLAVDPARTDLPTYDARIGVDFT